MSTLRDRFGRPQLAQSGAKAYSRPAMNLSWYWERVERAYDLVTIFAPGSHFLFRHACRDSVEVRSAYWTLPRTDERAG